MLLEKWKHTKKRRNFWRWKKEHDWVRSRSRIMTSPSSFSQRKNQNWKYKIITNWTMQQSTRSNRCNHVVRQVELFKLNGWGVKNRHLGAGETLILYKRIKPVPNQGGEKTDEGRALRSTTITEQCTTSRHFDNSKKPTGQNAESINRTVQAQKTLAISMIYS